MEVLDIGAAFRAACWSSLAVMVLLSPFIIPALRNRREGKEALQFVDPFLIARTVLLWSFSGGCLFVLFTILSTILSAGYVVLSFQTWTSFVLIASLDLLPFSMALFLLGSMMVSGLVFLRGRHSSTVIRRALIGVSAVAFFIPCDYLSVRVFFPGNPLARLIPDVLLFYSALPSMQLWRRHLYQRFPPLEEGGSEEAGSKEGGT